LSELLIIRIFLKLFNDIIISLGTYIMEAD